MGEPLMRGFFTSMAVCWLCCLVTVALFSLLDFVTSDKSTPHLLYQRPLYLKVTQLSSYQDIRVSHDMHEIFVSVISCSYELWTQFLKEVLFISLTYEFYPVTVSMATAVLPGWISKKVKTTIVEPYQKWTEKPVPELESVEHLYFRTCDVCGGKRPIKNLDVSHTTGVYPSDLIQCTCPPEIYHRRVAKEKSSDGNCSDVNNDENNGGGEDGGFEVIDPEDILTWDETYGIVPRGMLERWRASDKRNLNRTLSKSNLTGCNEFDKKFEEFGDAPRTKYPIRNKMSSIS